MFDDAYFEYWRAQVRQGSGKAVFRNLAKRLDDADPIGGKRKGDGKAGGRKTLYDIALEVKAVHPYKVCIMKVGEFYEALGFDAVMLVMHAGLNPMGTHNLPRAGCPLIKVQETLDRLTSQGYSVVVVEEVPTPNQYGQKSAPKERYVSAVITPSSPQYVVGAAEAGDDVTFDGTPAPPVVGIASTAMGYTLMIVETDLRRVTVMEGLTAETAAARLAAGGLAPPLYRHVSLDEGHSARGAAAAGTTGYTRQLRLEVGNILAAATGDRDMPQVGYGMRGDNPTKALLNLVLREHQLPPDTAFETVRSSGGTRADGARSRPVPLTLTTAQQLGVLPTRSVPPLLQSLLPPKKHVPAACRAYLQELLLHPPPRDTAEAIGQACVLLCDMNPAAGGLPRLELVPPAKIAKLLRTREGTHVFFAEVSAMARAVAQTLEHDVEAVRRAGELLLSPVSMKVGREVTAEKLRKACIEAEEIIAAVVAAEVLEGDSLNLRATDPDVSLDDDKYGDDEYAEEDEAPAADEELFFETLDVPPRLPHVPRQFQRINEQWRGRVRREVVAAELEKVEAASRALSEAIEADLVPLVEAAKEVKQASTRRCQLEHCQRNNTLWLRYLPAAVEKERKITEGESQLKHPVDRFGKVQGDRWSTPRVERALEDYRVARDEAGKAVSSALRKLAEDLETHAFDLVSAATFSIVAEATLLHVAHAGKQGWRPATLLPVGDNVTHWKAKSLKPFWMHPSAATPNDLDLAGLALLTGPNMAGKSTIIRAAAASALLASCGLFCPVESAQVPFFDALIVRMASTDSPSEGLSSYAVEMTEVAQMLDVATGESLVFIDELGRGTEAMHGTAVAGAVFERLDQSGVRGIFATHLHGILDLNLNLSPYASRMRMEIAADPADGTVGRFVPTWRMVPGECRESLALQTALDMKVPLAVVERSEALLQQLDEARVVRPMETDRPVIQGLPFAASVAPPLEALGNMLHDVAVRVCGGIGDARVGLLKMGQEPPPNVTKWTCVYVIRRSDGYAYCGETDDLASRLKAHRNTAVRERNAVAKKNCENADDVKRSVAVEMAYLPVPVEAGGKSMARQLEASVIRRLLAEGVPLLSVKDARNTSFGSAA